MHDLQTCLASFRIISCEIQLFLKKYIVFLCTYFNICFGDSVTHVAIFKNDINIKLILKSIIHFPEMKLYTSFAVLAGLLAFSQACFVATWTPNPAPAPSPPAPSPPAPSPPAPSPLVRSSNQGAYLNLLVQFKS